VKEFIIQVAALSWAATQVPEITVAIQSFLNTGFLSAVQLELSFMIGCLHLVTKAARSEFIVERDHGPPTGCTASFHTTRWGIVMRAAQSQAPGSQPALAELCRLYWSPLCLFVWHRGLLREEVGRNVSDQAETDEGIHALC